MAAHGCPCLPCLPMAVPDCPSLLMAQQGYTWLPTAAHCCPWLPNVAKSPWPKRLGELPAQQPCCWAAPPQPEACPVFWNLSGNTFATTSGYNSSTLLHFPWRRLGLPDVTSMGDLLQQTLTGALLGLTTQSVCVFHHGARQMSIVSW